jgi:hypothetical protein
MSNSYHWKVIAIFLKCRMDMKLITMCVKSTAWIWFVLLPVLSSCLKKQVDKLESDKDILKLQGNVKSMLDINYSVSGKYTTYFAFNKKGCIVEQTSYNNDGSLIRKWIYTYDSKNNKQKRYCYVEKTVYPIS